MINNNNNILLCKAHNERSISLNMEKNISIEKRPLCIECIHNMNEIYQNKSVQSATEEIRSHKQKEKAKISPYIQESLDKINTFYEYVELIFKQLQDILNPFKKSILTWINILENRLTSYDDIDILKDFQFLIKQEINQNQLISEIQQVNYRNQFVIDEMMKNIILQVNQMIKDLSLANIQASFRPIERKLINEIKIINEQEQCLAMSFNQNDKLLAISCGNQIKLWKIEDYDIIQSDVLSGQNYLITSLIFSQQSNWIITGEWGMDEKSNFYQIVLWKEINPNKWEQQKSSFNHYDGITCLILNKNEDELISSSRDKTIIVWKLNYYLNQIDYQYRLKQHSSQVTYMSLNQAETNLISCSYDKQIIIWNKQNKKYWQVQQIIINSNEGNRITFLNDYYFISQSYKLEQLQIYEYKNKKYELMEDKKLQLNEQDSEDFSIYFPFKYNQERQIVLCKHHDQLHLIKKNQEGNLNLLDKIELPSSYCFGTISNNGKYIVIWNAITSMITIYDITYKQ